MFRWLQSGCCGSREKLRAICWVARVSLGQVQPDLSAAVGQGCPTERPEGSGVSGIHLSVQKIQLDTPCPTERPDQSGVSPDTPEDALFERPSVGCRRSSRTNRCNKTQRQPTQGFNRATRSQRAEDQTLTAGKKESEIGRIADVLREPSRLTPSNRRLGSREV